ncbi:MAG TPA: hypothetical protein VGP25_08655 [Gemmatimonadaceae bacterium]|nr:hypothetical protein [Gemmatimonadaceae bacterium]
MPVTPSLDAEITMDPPLVPVIIPLVEMLAIAGLELENRIVRPLVGIVSPEASRSVSSSCVV